jgi:hypothetical protein
VCIPFFFAVMPKFKSEKAKKKDAVRQAILDQFSKEPHIVVIQFKTWPTLVNLTIKADISETELFSIFYGNSKPLFPKTLKLLINSNIRAFLIVIH